MSKLQQLRQAGKSNVIESAGGLRVASLPPGIEAASAVKMPPRMVGLAKETNAARIPLDKIEPDPNQPREEFDQDALLNLAESLKERGQLQPIRVRWDEPAGVYRVLCGERRWRAASMAGLTELSCIIHQGELSEHEVLAIQLVENALREDLRPVEQARAYRSIMDAEGLTTRQLATALRVSQPGVVRALALLELPEAAQEAVEQGDLAPAVAYEISKAAPEYQQTLVDRAVSGMLKRDDLSKLLRKPKKSAKTKKKVIRTQAGPRITIEWGRGLSNDVMCEALKEALNAIHSISDG